MIRKKQSRGNVDETVWTSRLVDKFRMMNMEISAGPQPVNSTETSSHHCNWLWVVTAGKSVCVCVRGVIMTFHPCLRSPRWGCLCCLTGLSCLKAHKLILSHLQDLSLSHPTPHPPTHPTTPPPSPFSLHSSSTSSFPSVFLQLHNKVTVTLVLYNTPLIAHSPKHTQASTHFLTQKY